MINLEPEKSRKPWRGTHLPRHPCLIILMPGSSRQEAMTSTNPSVCKGTSFSYHVGVELQRPRVDQLGKVQPVSC
jgi:hypothetical protein